MYGVIREVRNNCSLHLTGVAEFKRPRHPIMLVLTNMCCFPRQKQASIWPQIDNLAFDIWSPRKISHRALNARKVFINFSSNWKQPGGAPASIDLRPKTSNSAFGFWESPIKIDNLSVCRCLVGIPLI